MSHKIIAKAFCDGLRQGFMRLIAEFNDMAGFNINQMMMMAAIRQIIPRPPTTKIAPFQNAAFFKQAHRAIDRGD